MFTQISDDWRNAINAVPLRPFDDHVLAFFDDLSKRLIKNKDYSDVATFGFWCRKSALLKEKTRYDDLSSRIGKGVVFHSTPSNVPVNFAFSFAAGLIAGNANIVRLPAGEFGQVSVIVDTIKELLAGKHKALAPYLHFIRYMPDKTLHDQFSAVCDIRVVWGGDATINELRRSPLKPRATELTFADRYSVAVINANEYINSPDKSKIARDFYNDTYFTDQNACTSPCVIFWIGDQKKEAKTIFWESVRVLAREIYELKPIQAVGKLAAFYKAAANVPVSLIDMRDLFVTRVGVADANEELMLFKYNSGFFYEKDIDDLTEILPICGERMQTLVYYGLTKECIAAFIKEYRPKGIDRAVPMGYSMNFTLVWDGCDLVRHLSRKVVIQ